MSASCPSPASGSVPEGFTPFPPPPPALDWSRRDSGNPAVPRGSVVALAGLLALAITLVAAGLLIWRLAPAVPTPPPIPAPVSPPPATVEGAMPILQAQADAWLPGAAPSLISMQIDWPWELPEEGEPAIPQGGWINAVFVAPWQPGFGRSGEAATLTLLYDRGSGRIVDQSALAWQSPPAAPPAWTPPPVDSTQALALAEDAAGREYRLACPDYRHLTRLSLLDRASGTPMWLADYEDSRAPDLRGLVLRIDATSGDIVDQIESAPPCDDQDRKDPGEKPRKKKQQAEEPAG